MYLHIVFSTRFRCPMLGAPVREDLYRYAGALIRNMGGYPLAINGTDDHMHVLLRMPTTLSIARLVGELKSRTSFLFKEKAARDFAWQNGYSVTSVSPQGQDQVKAYIANQESHHAPEAIRARSRPSP